MTPPETLDTLATEHEALAAGFAPVSTPAKRVDTYAAALPTRAVTP